MGCWSPKTSPISAVVGLFRELIATRTRRCFSASPSRATRRSSGIGARLRRISKDWALRCDAAYQSGQQFRH